MTLLIDSAVDEATSETGARATLYPTSSRLDSIITTLGTRGSSSALLKLEQCRSSLTSFLVLVPRSSFDKYKYRLRLSPFSFQAPRKQAQKYHSPCVHLTKPYLRSRGTEPDLSLKGAAAADDRELTMLERGPSKQQFDSRPERTNRDDVVFASHTY
ncbi:hypothetical protein CONLIGDRAFT_648979 [Coniochaeta ligniaria NRRL 30616]|uniref:Uncharacterized protein n=1 Tax=Coniochaeta ligniaria NRRL 30616 TaxID=1408157 RepID=A0A1J7J310_9PEZI|nr:hypothetical protein CONLIGDRAFT_648979 [Coniochaeta ligniaria NRRL 30616]